MASHNNAEQEDSAADLPTTDSEPGSDAEASEIDEEELNEWMSATYKPIYYSKKPMKIPLTAPWDLSISDADVEKLRVGFKSHSMDDKWDLLVEDPDKNNGGFSVHIIRNWLAMDCYVLHITPRASGADEEKKEKREEEGGGSGETAAAKISGITWEGDKNGLQCSAEQARKEAVMLCRGWLGCEFEALPQYPSSVFWDPKGYKKLGKPEGQAGSSNGDSSAAGEAEEEAKKEVDPSLRLHVMSLGGRYWNEIQ